MAVAMVFVMAELILNGSGGDSETDVGVGSGSWSVTASLVSVPWAAIAPLVASLVSVSAIGSDSAMGSNGLVVVVNWRMGTVAPLSGVIPTGGDDPGLRWGVSIQSSSMWFRRLFCISCRPFRGFG